VRRMHVLVTAGAVLPIIVLTACSGKPNDLRHYGHDETPPSSPSALAGSPEPMGNGSTNANLTPSQTSAPRAPQQLDRNALSLADLADEEVQPDGEATHEVQDALADCGQPLRANDAAVAGYQTAWKYQTGSTLRQYVAAYDGEAADVVAAVRAGLDCGQFSLDGTEYQVESPFELGAGVDADAQVGWCARSTRQTMCTALITKGSLLTTLTVTASTENRAKPAVIRIAPRAATALNRA
jgi:hypothetical protein